MIPSLTYDTIQQAVQDGFMANSSLTNFGSGSAAGAFTAVIADAFTRIQTLLQQAVAARDIDTAQGTDLDNLARAFGITRLQATRSGSDTGSAQLLVTNTSGSVTLAVPSGLAVWSPSDPAQRFYTANALSLGPGQSGAVAVSSSQAGQYYDVAPGSLTAQNGNAALTVVNFLPVQGGSLAETDAEFRYRITETLQAALTGGPTTALSIESAVRNQPGVLDAILLPQARGPGTLDVLVVPDSGYQPDDDYLTSMQNFLATVAACGISVKAIAPTQVPIDVAIMVNTTGGSVLTPTAPLQTLLQTVVQNYINSRTVYVAPRPGRTLVGSSDPTNTMIDYTVLLGLVIDAATSQLGSKLQTVTVSLSTGSGQRALQGDLYPRDGEIFVSRTVSVTTQPNT